MKRLVNLRLREVKMRIVAVAAAALAAAACARDQALPTFPNIEYLGGGYDILRGNPFSQGSDPGFRTEAIFEFTFNQGRTYDNT